MAGQAIDTFYLTEADGSKPNASRRAAGRFGAQEGSQRFGQATNQHLQRRRLGSPGLTLTQVLAVRDLLP